MANPASFNSTVNAAAGTAQRAQASSFYSLLASLSISLYLCGAGLLVFIVLKDRLPRIYQPRVPDLLRHGGRLTPGFTSWVVPLFRISDEVVRQDCGLDSYLFLRYLYTLSLAYGCLSLAVVPLLLPLNIVGGAGLRQGVGGLNQLGWSNISEKNPSRLWAHLSCTVLTVVSLCTIITRELTFYVSLRTNRPRSAPAERPHLVLLRDIPTTLLSVNSITELCRGVADCVHHVEIVRRMDHLCHLVSVRDKTHESLERAVAGLIKRNYARCRRNSAQTGPSAVDRPVIRRRLAPWLPRLPGVGSKEDEISVLSRRLASNNREVEKVQIGLQFCPQRRAAVLQVRNASEALALAFTLDCAQSPYMVASYLGHSRTNILWDNLGISRREIQLRTAVFNAIALLAVVGWAIPVAYTGALSQVSVLATVVPWLSWVDAVPVWLLGFIQGVLPQVFLSILMAYFPFFLRTIVEARRFHTKEELELSCQSYYFVFLFIHVFLVVSIASSITSVLAEVAGSPRSTPSLLARNLPKASNYFLSYLLLQAFSTASTTFLQPMGYVRTLWSSLVEKTPRDVVRQRQAILSVQWSTVFPFYTNLACIVIIFSTIAPIILVIGCLSFTVLWAVNRYSVLYVTQTEIDMEGRLYPYAVYQLFTGVYVLELCTIGLFAVNRDSSWPTCGLPQTVVMVFTLLCTTVYHAELYKSYGPLLQRASINGRDYPSSNSSRGEALQLLHPALTNRRPVLWIPQDPFGLGKSVIDHIEAVYKNGIIPTSQRNTALDEKGNIFCAKFATVPHSGKELDPTKE